MYTDNPDGLMLSGDVNTLGGLTVNGALTVWGTTNLAAIALINPSITGTATASGLVATTLQADTLTAEQPNR